jgi:excinuclease ABC subunit B
MYADTVTGSMERAIKETNRRRKIQDEYNKANGIVPKTIIKSVRDVIEISTSDEAKNKKSKRGQKTPDAPKRMTKADREAMIEQYTAEMKRAAKQLDFERAAMLRDKIKILKDEL